MTLAGAIALYSAGAYAVDVLARPAAAARRARAAATARGKPLINVGCGTPGSSLRTALFGPTKWGDVNCDVAADGVCTIGQPEPCQCDARALPYPDRTFGAALASHVLEHVEDPVAVLAELHRVADVVCVVVPRWWAPHTWLHPGHRWYFDGAGGVHPLWRR